MKVEISNITECNIDIVVSEAGDFSGEYGVSYDAKELDSTAIHNGRMYRFTHLMPIVVSDVAIHFLVKLWEDGEVSVYCHVTNHEGEKVAEATGRSS